MKVAVVVGANGFVGSQLCTELVKNDVKVYAVVRSEKSDLKLLEHIEDSPLLEIVNCDYTQINLLGQRLRQKNADTLYYIGWSGVSGGDRANYEMQLENVRCMLDSVIVAKELGIKRFVGAGTLAEIDVNNYSGKDGSTPNAVSIYGVAKITAHYMSKAICNQYKIEHIWAYIGNVYGENDESNNFINFAIDLLKSDKPKDFTVGEQLYDFVHIKDVGNGLFKIGQSGITNYAYYIGSGKPQKLKDFIRMIRDAIDPRIELNLGAIPYNGVSSTKEDFDCTKIYNHTEYMPTISFEKGIQDVVSRR